MPSGLALGDLQIEVAVVAPSSPMSATDLWREYVDWLRDHVPAAHANLAPGADDAAIAAPEARLGVELPEAAKAIWRCNDGQRETMLAGRIRKATPCLPTLSFLSTAMVAHVWGEWDELRRTTPAGDLEELHGGTRSVVPGVVKPLYTTPAWIPLWADPTRADFVGLDLDPGEAGRRGQLINFGRNEDDHYQLATDLEDLLAFLVAEVTSGEWPASEMGYGDETIPWFGAPRAHFFNALVRRWEERNPRPARKK
jgi:cell wall assembly regulator SMI1